MEILKDLDIGYIKGYENIVNFFKENKNIFLDDKKIITFDIETKHLELKDNKLLGFGIGFSKQKSRYIITRDLTLKQLKNIFSNFNKFKCKIVLHNAYFDISQLNYMLGFNIKWDICTYITSHSMYSNILLENKGGLSLKELCSKCYIELYGYEDELEKQKREICKEMKIKVDDFTYDLFDDETLIPYANYDVLVTYALYEYLKEKAIEFSKKGWKKLPKLLELKHKVTDIYIKAKVVGIRVDRNKVMELYKEWSVIVQNALEEILKDDNIKTVEAKLYFIKYNNLIDKRKKEYEKKLDSKKQKIKEGKYTVERLEKDRENIYNLTQKMLDKIEEESKFNLKSPEHKKLLFIDVLGLKPLKFNKEDTKGNKTPKTDKEFLEYYSYVPLIEKIKEYSLFIKGLDGFLGVNDEEGKNGLWNLTTDDYPFNHPNSNLQGTITHRVAQNSINLQQLPSRGKLSELKKCIIPLKDNHRIVALDYSSCELYILGALSKEPNLINAIKDNLDLHSNMAYGVWGDTTIIDEEKEKEIKNLLNLDVLVFEGKRTLVNLKLPIEDKLLIIKELMGNMRYNAKSINFGLPYGIQAKGLANNMKVKIKEANIMLNTYMEKNQKIKEYMDRNKDFLCENGFIEGEHGQRIYMGNSLGINWEELESWDYEDKKYILEELRKSTNYIIQSENAMVIYEALIRLDNKIKELGYENKFFILTTIYDACYMSVDNSISNKEVNKILREVFEVSYTEDVSFRVDIEYGNNFKELEAM